MKITTSPGCRVGSEGQTLTYVVRAEGATEILAPTEAKDGMIVRVLDQRRVGDAVEANLAVDVRGSAPY